MIIFKTVAPLKQYLEKQRITGKTIGFIPTMGALHQGHLSLIAQSQSQHPLTVVSIFVNPAQFNDPKDFTAYPVTLNKDCLLLERQHTDILFLPSVDAMYPSPAEQVRHYELGGLEDVLEGYYRPGHFQGVCKAVERLLQVVEPDELFLGRKDLQQCMVIKRLLQLMQAPVQLAMAPTLREPDGLAMSSRNQRLGIQERKQATAIFEQMSAIKNQFQKKEDPAEIKLRATENLLKAGFGKVDYVEIADAESLDPLETINPEKKAVVLVAASFPGSVRLIDNLELN